jgi:type I restriction enzyme, S subunit
LKTKTFRLEEIVLGKEGLLKGPFGSDLKRSLYVPKDSSTYKVYLQENILKSDLTKGTHHISNDYFVSKMSRYAVKEGDFIVTCDGTLGEIFRLNGLKEKGIISSSLLRITLNESKVDPIFFPYFWSTRIKKPLIRSHNNSVLKHLPGLKAIRAFTIELPSLAAQKSIAKVLSDIDAKIVLNNKINAELESMAKLIYDYWFVQFDFPDENGKPYRSSGGKMVYNEKLNREIPQDWSNGELQDIANITMGQSPSGDSYNEDRNGEVFYQGCTDFGLRFPTNRKFTTQPTRFAKTGDILLSVRAPVGTMNIANEDCCIGRGLAALNSKNGSITHLDGVLQHMKQIFDLRNSSGTTFGSITKGDLFSIPVVIPDKKTLQRFDEVTNPMFEKQNLIGSENQMLEELRDWLLPMLMNGQVTIKD